MRYRCAAAGCALAAFLGVSALAPARAATFDDIVADIRSWATAPVAVLMIDGRNAELGDIGEDEILALDDQWRQETRAADKPLIARIVSNPLSTYLLRVMAESGGLYTEIAVMDAVGLNVGQSAVTTDYWQGDEDKYLETFPRGAGAVHLGEVETRHDGRRVRQVSLTLARPADGTPIGAVFVEVDLDELAER